MLLTASGCTTEHRLLVNLRSDLVPELEFGRVRVMLLDERGAQVAEASRDVTAEDDLVGGIRVGEFEAVPGIYLVRAQLLNLSLPVLEGNQQITLQGTKTVTLTADRSCIGVTCPAAGGSPAALSCLGGACVECGDESCVGTQCTSAATCTEAAACADALCDSGGCFYAPRHERCGAGELCVPTEGCRPRNSPDGGPPDGGSVDASTDSGRPCVPEATEVCNGVDDNCNGVIDEGFDLSLATSCGECGAVCTGATPLCVPDGSGGFECSDTCAETMCGGACVDTDTSGSHCGGCDAPCDAGESCVGGACACGGVGPDCGGHPTSTCCGSACVDTTSSSADCGACGVACDAGEACAASSCRCGGGGPDCTGDATSLCCGASCVDSLADEENCLGCGNECDLGEVCGFRGCTCGSPTGPDCTVGSRPACCGSGCTDVFVDEENCGGCGIRCRSGETCLGGLCRCGGGTTCEGPCCGGMCEAVDDVNNCGGCGIRCAPGERCEGGLCACGSTTASGAGITACADAETCVSGRCCCFGQCADGPSGCGGGEMCCAASMSCASLCIGS